MADLPEPTYWTVEVKTEVGWQSLNQNYQLKENAEARCRNLVEKGWTPRIVDLYTAVPAALPTTQEDGA